jgi:hypothetical protein
LVANPKLRRQIEKLASELAKLLASLDDATEGHEITPHMRRLARESREVGERLLAAAAHLTDSPATKRQREYAENMAACAILLDRDLNGRDESLH